MSIPFPEPNEELAFEAKVITKDKITSNAEKTSEHDWKFNIEPLVFDERGEEKVVNELIFRNVNLENFDETRFKIVVKMTNDGNRINLSQNYTKKGSSYTINMKRLLYGDVSTTNIATTVTASDEDINKIEIPGDTSHAAATVPKGGSKPSWNKDDCLNVLIDYLDESYWFDDDRNGFKIEKESFKNEMKNDAEEYFRNLLNGPQLDKVKGIELENWVRKNKDRLIKTDNNESGTTKHQCSKCRTMFFTPPIEHNGEDYCGENCKNKANKDKDKKYTCEVCRNEFTGEPTTDKSGKKCCDECKDKVDSNSGTKVKDKDISKIRTDAISAINTELNSNPSLKNSDLEQAYQNWESQIKNLDNDVAINDYKNEVVAQIKAKRQKKQDEKKVQEDLARVQSKDATIEDKEKFLDDLKTKENESSVENNKEEVDKVRKEVAKNDPTKYRSKVINDLPDKLTQNGLTKDELDDETKNEIKALEQETDPDKIVEKEVKITQKIGQQGATKKITTFEKRVEAALKSNNKTEIDKLKKELTEYIQSNNVYYQAQKEAAEKLFNQLKQASSTNQQKQSDSPSKIPWGVIIPISLVGLGAIVAVVVIRNRRKAKLNK